MQKFLASICASMLALGLFAGLLFGQTSSLTVPLVISPSTINLKSQGVWVTVHAEIPYSDVANFSVTLNGISVKVTKADVQGDLVAKFCVADVKDIVERGTAALTLSGTTIDGEQFTGSDTIKVVDVGGK